MTNLEYAIKYNWNFEEINISWYAVLTCERHVFYAGTVNYKEDVLFHVYAEDREFFKIAFKKFLKWLNEPKINWKEYFIEYINKNRQ